MTLTASPDTFRSIMTGDLDPTVAFMTGRLSVDGGERPVPGRVRHH